MERPIFKPVGTPVEELDTPSLVVDLSVLEQNIETMHSFFRDKDVKLRPHMDGHRCPPIGRMQLQAGGTAGGICVTTLGEAEVFAEAGFDDIFVANLIVTPAKIARLCVLARRTRLTVEVDSARNVADLSEAAVAAGVMLAVVVDVNTRLNRFGVEPGQPVVDLAREVSRADGLEFAGLATYEGTILHDDEEELAAESRSWIQQVLDSREMVERAGMEVAVISVGGTSNYETAASMPGVTEVPAGSYALMDQEYRDYRSQFSPAARILNVVTSTPEPGLVITDAGQKAVGADTGLPAVDDMPGATVRSLSAEHGSVELGASTNGGLKIGDKVWFVPWDIESCVNLHDYMFGARDGRLELVWDIPARGRYQ